MKMKYTSAIAIAIWLAVTSWLATMVIVKPAVLHLGNAADETAAMSELRSALERNRQAHARIASLRQADYVDDGRQLVAVRPAQDMVLVETATGFDQVQQVEGYNHHVSMVMDTNGRRTAIINGNIVHPGARLADGSRVRGISGDRVRIQSPSGEIRDLRVQSPFLQQAGGKR